MPFEYFELIKNKDIESLMNLFSPDVIIYEPFSKLKGGISGRQAIGPFLTNCDHGNTFPCPVANRFEYPYGKGSKKEKGLDTIGPSMKIKIINNKIDSYLEK